MTGPEGWPVAEIGWPGLVGSAEPVTAQADRQREVLVLIADFNDNAHTRSREELEELLFATGQGSMTDYYLEVSYGGLEIAGTVAGWYRMARPYSYYLGDSFGIYGEFPHNSQGLVADLVSQADAEVDFSRYDGDSDGVVDGLLVVHAGVGAEETGSPVDIWSHKWQLSDPVFGSPGPVQTGDGVSVDVFSVQPERFENDSLISIGVFCHELGHVLGLPDLYDTDYSSGGIGQFCLMSAGSWARSSSLAQPGSSPAHPCAWCKYQLGWLRPDSVEQGMDSVPKAELTAVATGPSCYRMLRNSSGPDWNRAGTGDGEYFLVENRQRVGFDAGLTGEGLLITHVDESQSDNDDENHPLVGILQADGSNRYLLPRGDRGDGSDLWKESDSGVTGFTVPSTMFYDGVQSGVVVRNISSSDSVMTVSLEIEPLFLGRTHSFPNPVLVLNGSERATIVYEPSDPERLAGEFPEFTVRICNLAAEQVRVLDAEPDEVNFGHRAAYWDLKNNRQQDVTSGMYLYTIEIEEDGRVERIKGRLTVVR